RPRAAGGDLQTPPGHPGFPYRPLSAVGAVVPVGSPGVGGARNHLPAELLLVRRVHARESPREGDSGPPGTAQGRRVHHRPGPGTPRRPRRRLRRWEAARHPQEGWRRAVEAQRRGDRGRSGGAGPSEGIRGRALRLRGGRPRGMAWALRSDLDAPGPRAHSLSPTGDPEGPESLEARRGLLDRNARHRELGLGAVPAAVLGRLSHPPALLSLQQGESLHPAPSGRLRHRPAAVHSQSGVLDSLRAQLSGRSSPHGRTGTVRPLSEPAPPRGGDHDRSGADFGRVTQLEHAGAGTAERSGVITSRGAEVRAPDAVIPATYYERSMVYAYCQTLVPMILLSGLLSVARSATSPASIVALVTLIGLVQYRLYFPLHDCSHMSLFAKRGQNVFWGQLLAGLLFTVYDSFRGEH